MYAVVAMAEPVAWTSLGADVPDHAAHSVMAAAEEASKDVHPGTFVVEIG